jgi:hypothetical protein
MMESIIKAEARGNTVGRFRSAISHGRDQQVFVMTRSKQRSVGCKAPTLVRCLSV